MDMKKMLAVVAAASLVAVAAPAFAANPFSDVPANHWAYDAIEELAAKGVLEGYPNGTYRGGRTMTRYEIAAMVARLMNAGLTGEELERLKALVVEFQPELEALGVKVDDLDARVTSLEKGLKGWKISGQMRFDYNAYDKHYGADGKPATGADGNGFSMDRARLFLHRDMDNGLSFDLRLHNGKIDRYWLTAKDFLGAEGLTLMMGDFCIDWMLEDGTYGDMDAWFMDQTYRGALLKYQRGMFEIQGFYSSDRGHDGQGGGSNTNWGTYHKNWDSEDYGARIKFNFNEKLWLSVNAYLVDEDIDDSRMSGALGKYGVYWASLGINFVPGLTLKGSYFMEDIDQLKGGIYEDDSPDAYQIVLDIKQNVLKFTSLWAEYVHFDEGFFLEVNPWTFYDGGSVPGGDDGNDYAHNYMPGDFKNNALKGDVDVMFFRAQQKWNDKFSTDLRYVRYDQDGYDDAKEWSIEVCYQYTPQLAFYLGYADMDGRFVSGAVDPDYDNSMIRFRTLFNF